MGGSSQTRNRTGVSCIAGRFFTNWAVREVWIIYSWIFKDIFDNMYRKNSNTLATSCEELTHWRRPWFWEGLGAGGEGDDRGWDGWMASPTGWAWVWVNSGSLWWTGRPGVLQFMGSQRVGYDWATVLYWTETDRKKIWYWKSKAGGNEKEQNLED